MRTRRFGNRNIEIVFLPGDEEVFGDVVKNQWKLPKILPDSAYGRVPEHKRKPDILDRYIRKLLKEDDDDYRPRE